MAKSKQAPGVIDSSHVEKFRKEFAGNPVNRIALNAVTSGKMPEVGINREILSDVDMAFEFENPIGGGITDQMGAGTCWAYAELNWLRKVVVKKLKIKGFEFSGNFVMFYDKLEKCNFFLEKMIEWRDKPLGDHILMDFLSHPQNDGGHWPYLENIINKYGLVPDSVMPKTQNARLSRYQNDRLDTMLKKSAWQIRKAAKKKGATEGKLRKLKEEMMADYYRVVAILLGEPPKTFSWGYKEKGKKKTFKRFTNVTPLEFYKKACGFKPTEMVNIVSSPQKSMKYWRTYTGEEWTALPGMKPRVVLNLPIDELKAMALRIIKKKETCLFSADVAKDMHPIEGVLHDELYDYNTLFSTDFDWARGDILDYRAGHSNHQMIFCGVDLKRGKPYKWKVENSWGKQYCKDGFFVMNDGFFTKHVYSISIPKKHLTKKMEAAFRMKPVKLPFWHAFG